MSARVTRALAASVVLHGLAVAASAAVWDRSRPVGAAPEPPEELSVAVEVVWSVAPEAAAAPRPALTPSLAPQATLLATSSHLSAPALTPHAGTANLVRAAAREDLLAPAAAADVTAAGARDSLGPASPDRAILIATAPSSRAAAQPASAAIAASADAPALAARESPPAAAATAPGTVTVVAAGEPGPSWAPARDGNVRPEYPPLARRRGLEGRTLLKVEVLTSGKTASVAVISSSGYVVLDKAALAAVRQWKFVPADDVAEMTGASIEVPISFRLLD